MSDLIERAFVYKGDRYVLTLETKIVTIIVVDDHAIVSIKEKP